MKRCTRLNGITWLVASLTALPAIAPAVEKRVDNPVDAWTIAGAGPAGQAVESSFNRRPETLDTTDAKHGDFSLTFTVADPAKQGALGFSPGPFLGPWAVSKELVLHLWMKAVAPQAPKQWTLAVYDAAGRRAVAALPGMAADGQWREFTVPLGTMKADVPPDFAAVRAVQVEAELPTDARLWLDDVYFKIERREE